MNQSWILIFCVEKIDVLEWWKDNSLCLTKNNGQHSLTYPIAIVASNYAFNINFKF